MKSKIELNGKVVVNFHSNKYVRLTDKEACLDSHSSSSVVEHSLTGI